MQHSATASIRSGDQPFLSNGLASRLAACRLKRKRRSTNAGGIKRLAAVGEQVTSVAHEVRNELHGMHMSLELLSDLLEGPSAASESPRYDATKWLQNLRHSVGRLGRLFEDLREFAAPVRLDCSVSGLNTTWRRAWDSLEPSWRTRNATFTDTTDNCVLVVLDALRMEQVFRNLFENSLAACDDPVKISIESHEVAHYGYPHLVVVVRDNGPGIGWNQHEMAFEPFVTTKPKGTGLGLAISRQIVAAHGGTITATPDRVAGAEFVISLPKFQPRQRRKVPSPVAVSAPTRPS